MTAAALLPLLWLALATSAAPAPGPDEVRAWAAGSACPAEQIRIETLVHHDFTGDGVPESVVVASTCATGDGGPNVHAVLARVADGSLAEVALPRLAPDTFDVLVGHRNFTLAVEGELLVQTFTDGSGRTAPLVVRYRWAGDAFEVESVVRSPTFPTSYDCSLAASELERGVCYVEPLAALDLALARAFDTARMRAAPSQRAAVKDGQRRWLADRDARCAGAKAWVECLAAAYRARLAELGAEVP